jgi:hypothetical protein
MNRVFQAAGLYHVAAGVLCLACPELVFLSLDIAAPSYLVLVRGMGFMMALFGLIYLEIPRGVSERLITIAVLGKFLGPLGWVWASLSGEFPPQALWIPLFHDLVWWPFFARFLKFCR